MTRETAREITRAAVESYYAEYGQYVDTPGQETLVTQLGARINKSINEKSFEEALDVMQRRQDFWNDTSYAPDGDRANDRAKLEEELTAAINSIVGNL